MSKFAELLAELNAENTASGELAKSIEAGAAGAEGNVDKNPEDDEGAEGAEGADGKIAAAAAAAGAGAGGEGGEKPLTKSILIDGEAHDVVDVEALMKSFGELGERVGGIEGTLEKALGGLVGTIKQQGALIKSLHEQVVAMGGQGRGRKAMLAVVERRETLTKSQTAGGEAGSEENGMKPEEFLAKSHAAFEAGKITGHELTVIDVSLRQNEAISHALLKKIVG